MGKKTLKIILIVIAAIIVEVAGYVAYVFFSFSRIEDDQVLQIENAAAGAPYGAEIYGEVAGSVPTGSELTIVSYNIGFGAYSDDYTFFMDGGKESWAFSKEAVYENIGGAMDTVSEVAPDIALIQEVDINGTRSYHIDEWSLVAPGIARDKSYNYDFAQNYDSPFIIYPFTQPHGKNQAGIMTFAAFKISSAVRKSLPIETGISKVIDLDRCYSKSRVSVEGGGELVIYNLHLSAYTANADTAENQLKLLIADMQGEYDAGNYCVAGGDFNRDLLGNSPEIFGTATLDDNWAKPVNMELFNDDIQLVVPFDSADPKASCRNPDKPYEPGDFVVTVDGFIRSANVNVTYSDVIDTGFAYSDHNPVMMRFELIR